MRVRRRESPLVRLLSPLRDFLRTEAAGGILLVGAAVVALVWANSPWSAGYRSFWDGNAEITILGHTLEMTTRDWLNDGLMTLFFLVVGLEIKREITSGHLASRRAGALPVVAAIGGMAVPAVLYLAIAGTTAPRGWGVPMATDIALAVGVLAVLGDRVPPAMRAFLLGLAIVDDIGAIVVIAAFYSDGVAWGWLAAGAATVAAAVAARAAGVRWSGAYWVLGGACWLALHEAGVHPTLTGVIFGLLAPVTPGPDGSVAERLLDRLHPLTSYVIVPLFALANTGIEINGELVREAARSPLTWGIVAGLVVGKPLGVTLFATLAARSGITDPVPGTRRQLAGIGAAAGIGFTVALFVAELAFVDGRQVAAAKLAIVAASTVSGLIAVATLWSRSRSSRTR